MLSGFAADRNRRPPTALLLAEGLETIAGQMEAAGTSRLASKGSGITPRHPGLCRRRLVRSPRRGCYQLLHWIRPSSRPPSPDVRIRAGQSVPCPGRTAGLPAATRVVLRQLSRFRQPVPDEPADYATAEAAHAVQVDVLLRLVRRLGARSLRYLHVPDHPGAQLNCSLRSLRIALSSPPTSSSLRDEKHVPSLLLSTGARDPGLPACAPSFVEAPSERPFERLRTHRRRQRAANSLRTTPMRSEVRTLSSATSVIDSSTRPKVRVRLPLGCSAAKTVPATATKMPEPRAS
jgi:hypothetical protein